jgi:hypothetical protein
MKLEISLFRFDKNSDYLPYYTKHFLKIENEKNLLDILRRINSEQQFGYEDNENFDLVVNGIYVKASITLEELVENFSKEIKIEPINIRRAYSDLLINDRDFKEKIEILSQFVDEEDREEYLTYKPYYYASTTLNYYYDYVGDALLLTLDSITAKHPEKKGEILDSLEKEHIGPSYYTSSKNKIYDFNKAHEKTISDIQKRIGIYEDIEKQNFRINNTLIIDFADFKDEYTIKHDLNDFAYSYYSSQGDEKYNDFLNTIKAKNIAIDTSKLQFAKNTFNINQEITYQIATTILLDAFDSGSDFLLVDNEIDFYIFDYNRKELERIAGRDVILPVIHINELQKLALGEHEEVSQTLSKHKINPEII